MKKLVDTSGWIEWLTNGKLADNFASYLMKEKELIVPTLIQYELFKWVSREKNSTIALEIIGITENSMVIPLDTRIALHAADISKDHGLAMADAIVYSSAILNNAILITADKYFKQLPNVKYFDKASS